MFVNTLFADDRYSLLNIDSLAQPVQRQLSKKQETLAEFFSIFLKSRSNCEHFEKQHDPHRLFISKI